jgi:hypothetical protein
VAVYQPFGTYTAELKCTLSDLTWELAVDVPSFVTYNGFDPQYETFSVEFEGFNALKGSVSTLEFNMFSPVVYLSSQYCGDVYVNTGFDTNWLCSFSDFWMLNGEWSPEDCRIFGPTTEACIWEINEEMMSDFVYLEDPYGYDDMLISFESFDEIVGKSQDTIRGGTLGADASWCLEGIDQGRVELGQPGSSTELIRFRSIPNIVGGLADDWFVMLPGGGLSGSLDGEDGINRFDYSGYGQPYDIDLVNWTATGIDGGITNIFGYDITTTVQGPGSVFPYNPKVYEGFDITIDIDPDTDYHLAELEIDSSPVAVTDSYTFTNVTSSRTLLAVIEPDLATNDTPAWWLHEYYPDTNDLDAAALSDTDDDDLDAWQEYIVGSNPTNAASTFVLQDDAVVPNGSDSVLSWASCSGRQYSVYYGTNLMNGLTLLPGADQLPATPPENSYTDTLHNVEQSLFYRIAVELAE